MTRRARIRRLVHVEPENSGPDRPAGADPPVPLTAEPVRMDPAAPTADDQMNAVDYAATIPPAPSETPEPPAASEEATASAVQSEPSPLRPQHARRRRNHRIILWSSVALLVVLVGSAGLVASQRIRRPLPQLTVATGRLTASLVPGSLPASPWPAGGQGAVAIPALGYAQQSGPEQPVPIASLTKMTTAVVVLRDHPVPLGSNGPTITITPDEAAQFDVNLANNETNIPLQAGETLTELQLLEALLNQSADDVAYTLAVWDAGSQQAFVARMNALASSLGAVDSHYVDASGFDPRSVSTAADTLRIAAAGMGIPTFATVVGMPTVNLPGVGTVRNIVTAIGTDGIVGVKSGYTSQASGCMVLAGFRSVGGHPVLVLASALGQLEPAPAHPPPSAAPPLVTPTTAAASAAPTTTTTTAPYSAIEAQYPLRYTEPIVEHLLDASEAAIVAVPVVTAGHTVGVASTEWGGARRVVPVVAIQSAWLLGIPGQRVTTTMASWVGAKTNARSIGAVRFTLGTQTATVPVRLVHRLADPGWLWKVVHN
jgi:serine-type D-Ala-D-Ala carboxypeptidase (penicillin-binding protein 5/6)